MRRTQAHQIQPGLSSIATATCRQCDTVGVAVLAYGTNENGAIAAGWCSVPCARKDGWPWLAAERAPKTEAMVFTFPELPNRDPQPSVTANQEARNIM
jgi:hypothetical protein